MSHRVIESERDLAEFTWHPVPGYEGRLEIRANGEVRSRERTVASRYGSTRRIPAKPLKAFLLRGYPAVQIRERGRRKNVLLHRAIATLFVPNPDDKPYVNHIDGDRANNCPTNLEWCTHAENMQHARRIGLMPPSMIGPGDKCPASKLTEAKVAKIKAQLRSGARQIDLAREYGVAKGTISFIASGHTWAHVEPAP